MRKKPNIPTRGTLVRDVRCVHLPDPVSAGTAISHIRFIRQQGDATVCQGWAVRPRPVGHLPTHFLVVFNLADLRATTSDDIRQDVQP